MKKNKILLLLLFLLFEIYTYANTVSVRILTTKIINTFIFTPLESDYTVYADGELLMECDPSGIFQMNIEGDFIRLKTFEKDLGKFSTIKIIAKKAESSFKIKSVIPSGKIRTYDNDLEIKLSPDKRQFILVNKVDLENYIAGVVESEGGKGSNLEYYKIQSVLCRTYLLAHINRHMLEGFEVCDDVHCQAYVSKPSDGTIKKAVLKTKEIVVVDNNLNLITAAFHSNCGGETCNSQDVWAMTTTYLKSIQDTYCLNQSQAHWERIIPLEDWQEYIQLKYKQSINSKKKANIITSFNQESGREIYFYDKDLKIPLKNIRADFKLKSTYFSIEQIRDSIIFKGRGYGHGVGLCQEGAMQMAKLKHPYENILHHYYKDVNLVDVSALNYFRQE